MSDKKLWVVFAFLFALVVVSSWGTLLTENAAKYAQVSREMLENKEWISLTIGGDPYDQKPPLMFWIGAIFYSLFGISDVVFRIGILSVSAIGVFATYKTGTLLYDKTTGVLATVFWSASVGYIHFHNDAHTDTVLASMVILSIWLLTHYFEKGNRVYFYCGIFAAGLAMLAKGPVGLIIPATAVGIHLMVNRRWNEIFNWQWLIAAPIIVVTILPALVGLYKQFGMEGIKFYFWTNNMGRITGSYQGSNTDPIFYIHTSLYVLAPFTVFAFGGFVKKIIASISSIRNRQKFSEELYTLGGILPYLLVLSVAKAKNPHYMLAVVPLIMILAARFAHNYSKGDYGKIWKSSVKCINIVLSVAFWLLIGLFVFWIFPEENPWYWVIIGLFVVALLLILLKANGFRKEMGYLTLSFFAFMFSFHFSFYQHMKTFHAPFNAVAFYNEQAKPNEVIHVYRSRARYWEILFYAKYPGVYYNEQKKFSDLLQEKGDWVFTDEIGMKEITALLPETKIEEFNHRQISRQSPAFLNPKTRESKLSKLYLLKLPGKSLKSSMFIYPARIRLKSPEPILKIMADPWNFFRFATNRPDKAH